MVVVKEGTKIRAIREAKGLIQSFGFNGFSFQHVADLLGIKKPSLFDHFKSKEELGVALVENYVETFTIWMETVEPFGPKEKIGALFDLFYKFAKDQNRVCMAMALSADYNSLPKSMQKHLKGMIEIRHKWMIDVLAEGQKKKVFRNDFKSTELAQLIVSAGWGAQTLSRAYTDPEQIKDVKETVLKLISLQK